jgi:two-component system sensor histidine kinase BarA
MEDEKTLDWELCLKQCNNNSALAKELFDLFIGELPLFKQKIAEAEKFKKQADLLDVIHKLHGACCYIGVPKLKNLVAKAEIQLKKGEDFAWSSLQEILSEIEKIEMISQPEKYHCS